MGNNCFLCGGERVIKKSQFGKHYLMECPGCHLQFIYPVPEERSLLMIYADYYKAWGIKRFQKEVSEMKRKTFQSYLNKISAFVSSGRLLDIGCATGELMEVARDSGFDVYGVEVAPDGILRSREKFGENKIIANSLKSEDFPNDFFDVITISDVMEHFADPRPFLNIIHKILKPLGVLMIVTPNASSWSRKILSKRWFHYKEEHLCYYRPENISRLLSGDFEIINIEKAVKVLTINYVICVLLIYLNNSFLKSVVSLLKKLPIWIKFLPFRLHIGEMFVLSRKTSRNGSFGY